MAQSENKRCLFADFHITGLRQPDLMADGYICLAEMAGTQATRNCCFETLSAVKNLAESDRLLQIETEVLEALDTSKYDQAKRKGILSAIQSY